MTMPATTPEETPWYLEASMPALLRHARGTFASAIRTSLADAGFDDVPANGVYVIGAIARGGAPLSQIISDLGVTKQAAGQLVDALVARGYLDRAVDPEDRRRLTIALTDRGQAAADASRSAIDSVESQLIAHIGAGNVQQARAALAMLIHIGRHEDGQRPEIDV
ncbi:MAG TPA: MarR family transcriptional regulator [Micromonosporaceae bacterium]|nr:MarR family transcriptional regulator [Micromonosporaceae bacterium]